MASALDWCVSFFKARLPPRPYAREIETLEAAFKQLSEPSPYATRVKVWFKEFSQLTDNDYPRRVPWLDKKNLSERTVAQREILEAAAKALWKARHDAYVAKDALRARMTESRKRMKLEPEAVAAAAASSTVAARVAGPTAAAADAASPISAATTTTSPATLAASSRSAAASSTAAAATTLAVSSSTTLGDASTVLQGLLDGQASRGKMEELRDLLRQTSRAAAQKVSKMQLDDFRATPLMRKVAAAVEAAQQAAGSYNCMGSMAEPVDDHVQHWIATLEKRGLDCATSIAECAEELAKDLRRLMQTDTGHVICFNHGAWKADDGPFKYMEADAFGLPSKKSAADGNCGACKWHSDAVLFGCSACAAKEPADGALCVLLYQDLPPSSHWANGRAYDVTMAKPSCAVQAALDQPGRAHRHGKLVRNSTDFAERLAAGKEFETVQAIRAKRKDQSARKELNSKFPAAFRKARSILDLGLSDMRQAAAEAYDPAKATVQKALSRGGSPAQMLLKPAELAARGIEAARAAEYLRHREAAISAFPKQTAALQNQKHRMAAKSQAATIQVPFWKETCLDADDLVADALKYFHQGSEATLVHFIALPFVRRMEFKRQQLEFAEKCEFEPY